MPCCKAQNDNFMRQCSNKAAAHTQRLAESENKQPASIYFCTFKSLTLWDVVRVLRAHRQTANLRVAAATAVALQEGVTA